LTSLLVKALAMLAVAGGVVFTVSRSPGHSHQAAATSTVAPTSTSSSAPVATSSASKIPADKLLGQRIMIGMSGTTAGPELLDRIRRGHVGAVILFAENIGSRSQLKALTAALQRAAHRGGNPPLLIATDQEGGEVKRLPNGPPDLSPPQIAATGSTSVARREGSATGTYLRRLGINMDLAPVLDVATSSRSFIWQQGRSFSMHAATVAKYATPFALGLQHERVAATGKHFPGLGSATIDTDNQLQELHPTRAQRRAALTPYRTLISRGLDAVMVSTAGFPAYDRTGTPAALSRTIIQDVLRRKLSFGGVAITDALGAPTGYDEHTAGVMAAEAGADILLFTDSAPGELKRLEHAMRNGHISYAGALASYQRVLALKRAVAGG
jgi:beta-N-acetylhexosaminidase